MLPVLSSWKKPAGRKIRLKGVKLCIKITYIFYWKSLYCYNESSIENGGILLASEVNTNKIVPEIYTSSYSDLYKQQDCVDPQYKSDCITWAAIKEITLRKAVAIHISVDVCQNPVIF